MSRRLVCTFDHGPHGTATGKILRCGQRLAKPWYIVGAMFLGGRRFSLLPEKDDQVLVASLNGGINLRQMVAAIRQTHPQQVDFAILWPGGSPGWRYLSSRTGKTAFLIELRPAEFSSVASQAQLLAGLVKQGAGRRVIDCEGYAYLGAQLLQ